MPAISRQTPSAEATARAQWASPTDLKVDRTSLKLCQTSGGEANGYHSAYPMKELDVQGYLSEEALTHCIERQDVQLYHLQIIVIIIIITNSFLYHHHLYVILCKVLPKP